MPAPENACSCSACVSACEYKPGWFMPGEAEKLAEALGVDLKTLFKKHLQVDYWARAEGDILVLSPRINNRRGGTRFPFNPMGQCHWLKDGLCEIHEKGKPFECAQNMHDGTDPRVHHEAVAMAWNTPEHQKQIEDLEDGL